MKINKTTLKLLNQKLDEIEDIQSEIQAIIENLRKTLIYKDAMQINVLEFNDKNEELKEEIKGFIEFCSLIYWR